MTRPVIARSEATKQSKKGHKGTGLLRFARNDGVGKEIWYKQSVLSGLKAQSDKNVSRETFW